MGFRSSTTSELYVEGTHLSTTMLKMDTGKPASRTPEMNIIASLTVSVRAFFAISLLLLGSACTSKDVSSSGSLPKSTISAPAASDESRIDSSCNLCFDKSRYCIDAGDHIIGVGDVLAIDVSQHDRLSARVPVPINGTISLPFSGEVYVRGRTIEDVGTEITERLAKSIRDPLVTVTALQMIECFGRIRVIGAVQTLISIPLCRCPGITITVLDAVLEAGGVTESAIPSRTRLFRRDGSVLPIRLDHILKGDDMATNYAIGPGDILTVPGRENTNLK